jgi:hypothetical protein
MQLIKLHMESWTSNLGMSYRRQNKRKHRIIIPPAKSIASLVGKHEKLRIADFGLRIVPKFRDPQFPTPQFPTPGELSKSR